MKKLILLIIIALPLFVNAQTDFQLHYDMGKFEDGSKRDFFVGTFETLHFDSLGYTYAFVDMEFDNPTNPKGASLGYFEIARTLNLSHNFMLHIEYNDGLVIYPMNDSTMLGENLRNSWLGGLEYGFVSGNGNLCINPMILYKYIYGSSKPDFQFTTTWAWNIFDNRFSLLGYVDVWSQDDFYGNPNKKKLVLYSEPQIWLNLGHLSVGSEIKISKNFFSSKRFEAFPTLGLKYQF